MPTESVAWSPVVAPLLRSRWLSAVLAAAGAAQVALTLTHVGGMDCPFFRVTGLPCPGCGLSRACAAGLRGDWRKATRLHAYWPLFLLAIGLFAIAAVLPPVVVNRFARRLDRAERRTRFAVLLLVGLVLYWAARLGYAPAEFAHLIATSR